MAARMLPVLAEAHSMKRIVFGSLIALATLAAPALAQGVHFGLQGGLAYPNSTMGDYATSGWDGGIALQFGAPLVPVAFRIDGTYSQMNGKSMTFGPGTYSSDFKLASGTGNIVWTVFGTALPTKIYVIGGIGYYEVQQKVTVTGAPAVPTVTKASFGYNAGIGVRFTKLFIEARWNRISDGLRQNDGTKTSLAFIPVNVGLLF
jgi:hypothetical protein